MRTEVRAEQREAVGGDPSVEPAMAPRVPWRLLAWLVFPLAMLGVLVVAADGLVLRLDEPLAALVRGQGWLDALRPLNELGSERQGSMVAVAVGALLWRRCRTLAVVVPATVLGAVAVNVGLKVAVGRARPPDPLTDTALASFPSGHVLHAVVLVGLVPVVGYLLTGRRWVAWAGVAAAACLVVVVALLRVHLGAHWPTDVTASMLIGGVILTLVWRVARDRRFCTPTSCGGACRMAATVPMMRSMTSTA